MTVSVAADLESTLESGFYESAYVNVASEFYSDISFQIPISAYIYLEPEYDESSWFDVDDYSDDTIEVEDPIETDPIETDSDFADP